MGDPQVIMVVSIPPNARDLPAASQGGLLYIQSPWFDTNMYHSMYHSMCVGSLESLEVPIPGCFLWNPHFLVLRYAVGQQRLRLAMTWHRGC